MKKKGVLIKSIISFSLLLITTCFITLSASAAIPDTPLDTATSTASSSVIHTGWGDEAPAPEPEGDEADGMTLLLIILLSMSIVAFGALCFKLFSNNISKKELVILLIILSLVVVVAFMALFKTVTAGENEDAGNTAFSNENYGIAELLADVGEASCLPIAYIEENIFGEVNNR